MGEFLRHANPSYQNTDIMSRAVFTFSGVLGKGEPPPPRKLITSSTMQ